MAGRTSHKGLSPALAVLSSTFSSSFLSNIAVLLPRKRRNVSGLGSSPVARHYWGNHYFIFSSCRY